MRFKKTIFLLIITILAFETVIVTGQTKLSADAENFYRQENFKEASKLYKEIIKTYPSNAIYRHRLGVCIYQTNGNLDEAEKHLTYSSNKGIRLSNLYLAKVKYKQYKFDSAIEYYSRFKNYIRKNDPRQQEIERDIERCKSGKKMLQSVEYIEILDTLTVLFDFFFQHFALSPETGSFSNKGIDDSIKPDSLFLLYLPEKGDRLFYSEFIDGVQQRDIFRKDKLLDEWSEPKPLNTINSPSNEIFPFLMSDGLTLYFASDRADALDGYDIFVTRYNPSSNDFLPPKRLGMPYNSFGNDYLYVIDEFKGMGWFASDRHNKKGFITIYKFNPANSRMLPPNSNEKTLRTAALLHDVEPETTTPGFANEAGSTQDEELAEEYGYEDIGLIEIAPKMEETFHFIVNDTTIYNRIADFKNREAISTFKQFCEIEGKTDSLHNEIATYRKNYNLQKDEVQRNIMSKNILNSEDKLLKLENRKDSLEQRTRKLEIDALQAYTKMKNEESEYRAPWKPKPLEIAIPKNVKPQFYNAYLNTHYTEIFPPEELNMLSEAQRNKMMADNLALDLQEILVKLHNNPNADRLIVEKLILRDSTFAEPVTREELARISEVITKESTEKYMLAHTEKYRILNSRTKQLLQLSKNKTLSTQMQQIIQEAEFQHYNAAFTTNNFTDYHHLNFDKTRETLQSLERANTLMENSIVSYWQKATEVNSQEIKQDDTPETETLITYKIQIGLFKNKPNDALLSKIPEITSEKVENSNLTRYYSGNFTDKDMAEKKAGEIDKLGFPGAFVVPFINGVKSNFIEIEKTNTK